MDPHTAVALAVAEKEKRDLSVPMVVLSTAHPAKFPDAVKAACGVTPALPDTFADLGRRNETDRRFTGRSDGRRAVCNICVARGA